MKFNLFKRNQNHHTLYSFKNKKWAYISYISDVYYKKKDSSYMLSHQNKREALAIGNVFHSLGYNVKVALFNDSKECDNRRYDIVFGLEPNFVTMCQKNPQALKIYYATGAYWKHQQSVILSRTDSFNQRNHQKIAYNRLVDAHESCDIADAIFQIGSTYTIQTYPRHLQSKIKIVNQSSNFTQQCDLVHKYQTVSTKDFLWFGSTGSILKGLDLVLETFMNYPQYRIHIVGPIDRDFLNYYRPLVAKSPNILFYGFLDTSSKEFMELAYRCSFNIFPSASEGCPGTVIALMQMGVIPIVSQWAAFDGIEDYGYLLPNLSTQAIEKAIQWSQTLSTESFQNLMKKNISHSLETWNLVQFEREFKTLLEQTIHSSHQQ